MTSDKNMNKVVRQLLREGWRVVSHNKHLKLRSPKGSRLIVSASPSCIHAYKNIAKAAMLIKEKENAT